MCHAGTPPQCGRSLLFLLHGNGPDRALASWATSHPNLPDVPPKIVVVWSAVAVIHEPFQLCAVSHFCNALHGHPFRLVLPPPLVRRWSYPLSFSCFVQQMPHIPPRPPFVPIPCSCQFLLQVSLVYYCEADPPAAGARGGWSRRCRRRPGTAGRLRPVAKGRHRSSNGWPPGRHRTGGQDGGRGRAKPRWWALTAAAVQGLRYG